MNEARIQRAVISIFRKAFPKYYLMLFAIENKRKTNDKIQGAILKQQGITSGVADLCLALPTNQFGALYIEMKFGKNKQTQTQKEWQKHCEANGNKYIVCYTSANAIDEIYKHIINHEEWKKQKVSEQSLIK